MKPLPSVYEAVLLRTDFADQQVWEQVRDTALASLWGSDAPTLIVVDDRRYSGEDFGDLSEPPEGYEKRVLVVFDAWARAHGDHPLLVIDWFADVDEQDEERFIAGSLRAAPDQVQTVEGNLSMANMDFDDFLAAADADGVFRGFR